MPGASRQESGLFISFLVDEDKSRQHKKEFARQQMSFGFRPPHPLTPPSSHPSILSSVACRLASLSETPLACTHPGLHTLGMKQRPAGSAQSRVSSLNPADFMRKTLAFKAPSFCKEAHVSLRTAAASRRNHTHAGDASVSMAGLFF